MAKLEDLLQGLRSEDLPPGYEDLGPVLTSIDAALTAIGNAFSGHITLADNVSVERIDVQLSHGVPQTVRLKKLPKAGSVIGYSCGTDANGTAHAFVFPPSVSPTSTAGMAQVTAYFKNNAATRVNCTIWIEPDGQTSSKTPSDTAWTAPTLLNSWVNVGGGFEVPGVRKMPDGSIRLKGGVKNGSSTGAIICTLAAAFRPFETRAFAVSSGAGGVVVAAELSIDASGNVSITNGGGTSWVWLEVSFYP